MVAHVIEVGAAVLAGIGTAFAIVRRRGQVPPAVDEPVVRERQFF